MAKKRRKPLPKASRRYSKDEIAMVGQLEKRVESLAAKVTSATSDKDMADLLVDVLAVQRQIAHLRGGGAGWLNPGKRTKKPGEKISREDQVHSEILEWIADIEAEGRLLAPGREGAARWSKIVRQMRDLERQLAHMKRGGAGRLNPNPCMKRFASLGLARQDAARKAKRTDTPHYVYRISKNPKYAVLSGDHPIQHGLEKGLISMGPAALVHIAEAAVI